MPKPKPEPTKVKPEPAKTKPPKPDKPADDNDAKSIYKRGADALRAGDFKKAIDSFNKCVQIDRAYCLCYRALGITYAKSRNRQKATRYYRLYLKYCPNATDAADVEKMLQGHEP